MHALLRSVKNDLSKYHPEEVEANGHRDICGLLRSDWPIRMHIIHGEALIDGSPQSLLHNVERRDSGIRLDGDEGRDIERSWLSRILTMTYGRGVQKDVPQYILRNAESAS